MSLYEGMFLLDNQVVREDWKRAKGIVTTILEKNGAKLHSARRWDERKLTYPIAKRRRATYLLAYFEQTGDQRNLARDLELTESVLRHLIVRVEAVPESEHELAKAEEAADFAVPTPPTDDVEDEPQDEGPSDEDAGDDRPRRRREPKREEEVEEEVLVEADATAEED